MDIIFYNGKINTLDDAGSVHSAVGATGGKITALGSDDELRGLGGPGTETVDLKGAVMFPGFMEAHNHLSIYGYLLDGIDLSPANVSKPGITPDCRVTLVAPIFPLPFSRISSRAKMRFKIRPQGIEPSR